MAAADPSTVPVATTAAEFKEEGNTLYKAGEYRRAIDAYTQAITLDPASVSFYTNRAAAYFMIKSYAKAAADCEEAVKLDASFVKAYVRAAKAYLAMVRAPSVATQHRSCHTPPAFAQPRESSQRPRPCTPRPCCVTP